MLLIGCCYDTHRSATSGREINQNFWMEIGTHWWLFRATCAPTAVISITWFSCYWNVRQCNINPLALELDIYSSAHHLCTMWIFYEPRRVTLGDTRHFVDMNHRSTRLPMWKRQSNSRTHTTWMRNTTRRKRTPNGSSSEDRQLAHKKRYAYQKTLQSIRRIHENDG